MGMSTRVGCFGPRPTPRELRASADGIAFALHEGCYYIPLSEPISFAGVTWNAVPNEPGVYVIADQGEIVYVGMAGRNGKGGIRKDCAITRQARSLTCSLSICSLRAFNSWRQIELAIQETQGPPVAST